MELHENVVDRLGVATALMPLLHDENGQPRQRYSPHRLTAAAELSDLAVRGLVRIDGDDVVSAGAPGPQAPAWSRDVLAELGRGTAGDRRVAVSRWTARRRAALGVHQEEAVRAGALHRRRGRLLGLVPYDRLEPVLPARARILDELTSAGVAVPAVTALAALVNAVGLARDLQLDAGAADRLAARGTDDLGEDVAAAIRCLRTTVLVSAVS